MTIVRMESAGRDGTYMREAVQKAKLTLRDFNICGYLPLGIRIKKRPKGLFGQPQLEPTTNLNLRQVSAFLIC